MDDTDGPDTDGATSDGTRAVPWGRIEANTETPARETAVACLSAALEASHPTRVVRRAISVDSDGDGDGAEGATTLRIDDATYDLSAFDRLVVVGGGKAAMGVADALEAALGDAIDDGLVVVPAETIPDDTHRTERQIDRLPGSHPVPSHEAVEGTRRLRQLLAEADDRTLVLAVVTGGASALLPAPATGIDLEALQSTTQALLDSGADIGAVNAVRKHLSELKGGGLARAAAPATVVSLVFSDVVGDRLDVIASGPTVPDRTTFDDALAVLDRYDVAVPESVRDRLHRGAGGDSAVPETPKPGDPVFDAVSVHVLASTTTGLAAARETAVERGYRTCLLSSRLRGEARATGTTLAAVAEEMLASGDPVEPPAVLLAGGESTVTIRGDGTGGPNGEVGVAFALEFDAAGADDRGPDGASDPVDALAGRVACLSADTDGIDGATDAAGALVDPRTAAGPDAVAAAREALADNDALPYLESRDAVVRTGPTGTNVNDVQFVVIEGDDDGAA